MIRKLVYLCILASICVALPASESKSHTKTEDALTCPPGLSRKSDGSCSDLPPGLRKQNQRSGSSNPTQESQSHVSRRNAPTCPPGLLRKSDGSCTSKDLPPGLRKHNQRGEVSTSSESGGKVDSQPHVVSRRSTFCDAGTVRTSDGRCIPVKPKSEKL